MVAAVALMPFAALAYPEGAPWTALDHPGEACASCHFGNPPVENSDALTLEGAQTPFMPGETYPITLRFTPEEAKVVGFLATFRRTTDEGGSVTGGTDLETNGAAVRSISGRPAPDGQGAAWSFDWTTPETPGPVTLQIAANAGNDDASPFGDVVHLKTLSLEVDPEVDRPSVR